MPLRLTAHEKAPDAAATAVERIDPTHEGEITMNTTASDAQRLSELDEFIRNAAATVDAIPIDEYLEHEDDLKLTMDALRQACAERQELFPRIYRDQIAAIRPDWAQTSRVFTMWGPDEPQFEFDASYGPVTVTLYGAIRDGVAVTLNREVLVEEFQADTVEDLQQLSDQITVALANFTTPEVTK